VRLVDANAHVIPPPEERDAFPLSTLAGAGEELTEQQVNSGEAFVALLDEAGVDAAFLFGSRFLGFDNGYCAAVVHAFPDRFVGIANVDVFDPRAPDHVEHWIDREGLHGVRVWGGRMHNDARARADWIADESFDPLWRAIARRGVPCNAQKTFPDLLPATRDLLRRVDGLTLTLNNLAQLPVAEGPSSDGARDLLALAAFPTVYVSFSVEFAAAAAHDGSAERALLEALLDAYGPDRLLWSAFYPSLQRRPYVESVELLRASLSFLSASEQRAVLGGAALALYPALTRAEVA
jgi:predicted TIM-barrel fold metal-dependent hydrolase